MTTSKRITDLESYTSVLPYASEIFGVYQPLIGWKSKRIMNRINNGIRSDQTSLLTELSRYYDPNAKINFNADNIATIIELAPGTLASPTLSPQNDSIILKELSTQLSSRPIPEGIQWGDIINFDNLNQILHTAVFPFYIAEATKLFQGLSHIGINPGETPQQADDRLRNMISTIKNDAINKIKQESIIAGELLGLLDNRLFDQIKQIFFLKSDVDFRKKFMDAITLLKNNFKDPFLTFNPENPEDVKNVSLSPLGIVHLFRQYFFELDTFLGTPVKHVWLSPGSSVELIETSTRRTLIEKTFETSIESTTKSETSTTNQDDISEAVKQDNKDNSKLGFSTTVNQSWGTGNATATGSINLDKTQQNAREQTHKQMRQQTEKLSTEIRQNFKTTFKTTTESTDLSSKRYVLNNTTQDLINYELRTKMRQVGVQVQDIGTYLCWETFVDEPGNALGLAHLVHIAKPADLIITPNPKHIPVPPLRLSITFIGQAVWNHPDNQAQFNSQHPEVQNQFIPLATLDIANIPNDYEIDNSNPFIEINQHVIAAEDDDSWGASNWLFKGMIMPDKKRVTVGLHADDHNGMAWNKKITFEVSGYLNCNLLQSKIDEITTANNELDSQKLSADNENKRKQEEEFTKTAAERIKLASQIKKRTFEDLREEERTIVYRNLIRALMSESLYKSLPETDSGFKTRHVFSELINSIFDIDKMLYFVAPEWWKPRMHSQLSLGENAVQTSINGSIVAWSDQQNHQNNYFITSDSDPAPLGSSLGWLLQLDGDNLRNAFLNAPWVKVVIPIRPGKEKVAANWLQQVHVEGIEGLNTPYTAPSDELDEIRNTLIDLDPTDPILDTEHNGEIWISDAIRYLCIKVSEKHDESTKVKKYPDSEIDDTNKVSSTPIEKVYEHGFYPLQGGFKIDPNDPDPDPNNADKNFQVFDQWIEVLPTDQIVPVEVKYNPLTGRQIYP